MLIENKEIVIRGNVIKIARLKDEYFRHVETPDTFIRALRGANVEADLFTFVQKATEREPKYGYRMEWDPIAVLVISSYGYWWKKQISAKTRNMVRKAQKSGIETRLTDFSDQLVKSIKAIYDETPIRQGRRFRHYGKDLETLKKDHASFGERSQFVGAFYRDELIGFVKLVHCEDATHIMQIMSQKRHWDKAPTNALMAKIVEVCAHQGVRILNYGVWSERGLGDFKRHNAFEQVDIPRYFVPLGLKGAVALKLGLHKDPKEKIPDWLMSRLIDLRTKWLERRLGNASL
jgi:hypothetical protein